MRIFTLNLDKVFYEMIARGYKKKEYREVKEFWVRRLMNPIDSGDVKMYDMERFHEMVNAHQVIKKHVFKEFDILRIKLGYGKSGQDEIDFVWKPVTLEKPNPKWIGSKFEKDLSMKITFDLSERYHEGE